MDACVCACLHVHVRAFVRACGWTGGQACMCADRPHHMNIYTPGSSLPASGAQTPRETSRESTRSRARSSSASVETGDDGLSLSTSPTSTRHILSSTASPTRRSPPRHQPHETSEAGLPSPQPSVRGTAAPLSATAERPRGGDGRNSYELNEDWDGELMPMLDQACVNVMAEAESETDIPSQLVEMFEQVKHRHEYTYKSTHMHACVHVCMVCRSCMWRSTMCSSTAKPSRAWRSRAWRMC